MLGWNILWSDISRPKVCLANWSSTYGLELTNLMNLSFGRKSKLKIHKLCVFIQRRCLLAKEYMQTSEAFFPCLVCSAIIQWTKRSLGALYYKSQGWIWVQHFWLRNTPEKFSWKIQFDGNWEQNVRLQCYLSLSLPLSLSLSLLSKKAGCFVV